MFKIDMCLPGKVLHQFQSLPLLKIVSLTVHTLLKSLSVMPHCCAKFDRSDLGDHSSNLVDESVDVLEPVLPQILLDSLKQPVICGG